MKFHQSYIQNKQYVSIVHGSHEPVQLAWIKLNAYDNQPNHFWPTFNTALGMWNYAFGKEQWSQEFPGTSEDQCSSFLDTFLSLLHKNPLTILMENIHEITNPAITAFLQTLVELETEDLAFIFISGTTIQDKTPKDTFYYNLSALHTISVEEERQYYESTAFSLTEDELEKIRNCTDGWPAAVQSMAHLLSSNGKRLLEDLEQNFLIWLEGFFLTSYTQPELRLLVQFSLLNELPLELISYFTKWSGEDLMPAIAESPIIRRNENGKCFYFANFARPYLRRRQVLMSNQEKEAFYLQAGDWYYQRDHIIEALKYYQKAKSPEQMLEVILNCQFPVTRETALCMIDAIADIPASLFEENPILHVILALMLYTLHRFEDAYQVLEIFCTSNHKDEELPPSLSNALGEAYSLWAHICDTLPGHQDQVIPLLQKSAALLPVVDKLMPPKLNLFADCPVIRLPSPEKGAMERHLTYLQQIEPYTDQLTRGVWPSNTQLAAAEMAFFKREFKDLEGNIRLALTPALSKGHIDIACSACFLLMRLAAAKGNYKKLLESLSMLRQYATMHTFDSFFTMPELAESWLHLLYGNPYAMSKWLQDESLYHETICPMSYGRSSILRAFFLLQTQQYDTLMAYARECLDLFGKRGYHLSCIYMTMLIAITHHMRQEYEQSVRAFETVYQWCYPDNIIMPIIEFGRYVRPLVEDYRRSGQAVIDETWLKEILKKANSYALYQHNIRMQLKEHEPGHQNPLNSLTTSEKKLLLMISRNIAAQEIADAQGKSLNSVKGMIRRLYTKIGANGKADAVRLATEYHIEEITEL